MSHPPGQMAQGYPSPDQGYPSPELAATGRFSTAAKVTVATLIAAVAVVAVIVAVVSRPPIPVVVDQAQGQHLPDLLNEGWELIGASGIPISDGTVASYERALAGSVERIGVTFTAGNPRAVNERLAGMRERITIAEITCAESSGHTISCVANAGDGYFSFVSITNSADEVAAMATGFADALS